MSPQVKVDVNESDFMQATLFLKSSASVPK
jgi:hypothetical protein